MIITNDERLFGYARVSTTDQELNLQVDALLAHGVEKQRVHCDKISGTREDRPGLTACNEAQFCDKCRKLVVSGAVRLRNVLWHKPPARFDAPVDETGFS